MIPIVLCYPEQFEDPVAEAERIWDELVAFRAAKGQDEVPLDDLIQYAAREDTPAIKLSDEAQLRLYNIFKGSSRGPTRERLNHKLNFGLSMWPALWWAKRINFHTDKAFQPGLIDYTVGADWLVECPRIRNAICSM